MLASLAVHKLVQVTQRMPQEPDSDETLKDTLLFNDLVYLITLGNAIEWSSFSVNYAQTPVSGLQQCSKHTVDTGRLKAGTAGA